MYLIECDKNNCREKYIGETGQIFKFRLDEQRVYINNKNEGQKTGAHFNLPDYSLANTKATIIEQVNTNSEQYRKKREHFYIIKLNTVHKGMNKQKKPNREGSYLACCKA